MINPTYKRHVPIERRDNDGGPSSRDAVNEIDDQVFSPLTPIQSQAFPVHNGADRDAISHRRSFHRLGMR